MSIINIKRVTSGYKRAEKSQIVSLRILKLSIRFFWVILIRYFDISDLVNLTYYIECCFCFQIGDWFVLYQLCKNCNPYFFREFIRELAIEMKSRPKKSKSTTTLASPQSPILSRPSPQSVINNGGASDLLLGRRASLPRVDDGIAV